MLSRIRGRKNEEGQALVVVIAVVAITAILMVALEVSVIGDAQLAATSTSQEQALQAAESGLADYQTWVNGSDSQWQYAMDFCSSGTYPGGSGQVGCLEDAAGNPRTTPPAANPDPANPAFSGVPDSSCRTSAYNATSAPAIPAGQPDYYGWVTFHGSTTGGFAEQFQYVVDSSLAKSLGGYVHVFVTGRAGTSHHYVCSTVKALYNGPQLTAVNTEQLAPAYCSGSTIPVTPPPAGTNINAVTIEATGGAGQTGGSAGLSAGGGLGGTGETVEATYAASSSTTLNVNIGCQGGSNTSITQGGPGFAPGGSLPTKGDAGGGGGATAVCSVSPCTSSTITNGNLASDLYLVAGGGGGGGEGLLGTTAAGGTGGNDTTTSVTSGSGENGTSGKNATSFFISNGGAGGAGGMASSGYSPAGGAGNQTNAFLDADGGGGGGGYNGGTGGHIGFGGGGGGAGASFYNTNTSAGLGGIGAFISAAPVNLLNHNCDPPLPGRAPGFQGSCATMTTTPTTYGQVIIQWENYTAPGILNPVGTPVVPATCGPFAERTTAIPALTEVSLEVSGGSGGNGDDLSAFGLYGSAGAEGLGAAVVATYQNTSTSPVYVTAIQGCMGAIGGDVGVTPGGDGLRSSGQPTSGGPNCLTCSGNQGDSGSAGGASAICVGTVAPGLDTPTNNNCYPGNVPSASDILMAAGGGGGGGGLDPSLIGVCSGGDAGYAGGTIQNGVASALSPNYAVPGSTTLTTGGVSGWAGSSGSCGGPTGGSGGSAATYGPTGAPGNANDVGCSGDGGAGGGGFGGAAAGGAGQGFFPGFCIVTQGGAGGGGGSSWLATSNLSLQLQQCPVGGQCLYSPCPNAGQSNPAANQPNPNSIAVDEGEWCTSQKDTNGAASVTDTAIPNSSAILSQSPASVETTTW
jgi:hypothetical protein